MEQQTGFKLGKEYIKAVYCHLLNLLICNVWYAKCWVGRLISWNQDCQEKYQQPQTCRWYHFNGIKQTWTEESLDDGNRESAKAGLKFSIEKIKIMTSSPITSWQTHGEKYGNSERYYFPGLQNHWGWWLWSWN